MLTGSEQFELSDSINQSLAGRIALLRLLPFTISERRAAGASDSIDEILCSGFHSRIHDQDLEPRQVLGEIKNLSSFRRFIRLCAGRVGQLINLSSLGAYAGVFHTTARQ